MSGETSALLPLSYSFWINRKTYDTSWFIAYSGMVQPWHRLSWAEFFLFVSCIHVDSLYSAVTQHAVNIQLDVFLPQAFPVFNETSIYWSRTPHPPQTQTHTLTFFPSYYSFTNIYVTTAILWCFTEIIWIHLDTWYHSVALTKHGKRV